MRSTLIIALFCLAPCAAMAEGKPTRSAIARAVADLGSETLETRIAARDFLWKVGPAARSALEQAAGSDDLETASTARYLLDRLELGVNAQMPPELIQAAESFRYGIAADKARSLPVLVRYQAAVVLARLASYEQPGPMRSQALEAAWKLRFPHMRQWLAQGDFADFDRFVKDISTARGDDRDWACYLMLRGEADNRIRSLQAAPGKSAAELKLLALLLRLQGDSPAALKIAEQAGDEEMIRDLAVETGRWGRLLSLPVPPNMHDKNAWFAAFFRLAGNTDALNEQNGLLEAQAKSQHPGNALRALEMNDHVADAIALYPNKFLVTKMTDLAAQGKLPEALACVGIESAKDSYLNWLKGYYPQLFKGKVDGVAWEQRPYSYPEQSLYQSVLEAAVILSRLGQLQPAIELVDELAAATKPEDRGNQFELFKTYRKLGSPPQTFACGARVLKLLGPSQGFQWLYDRNPTSQHLARFWWDYLGHTGLSRDEASRLERADELAFTSTRFPRPVRPSLDFVREAETWVLKQKPPLNTQGLAWLGQACLRYRYRSEAIDFLRRVAKELRSSAINMQLGMIFFADKRWTEAAERFSLAFDQDPSQLGAQFMKGFALVRAGQQRAGEYEVELARLMLLGDAAKHSEVARSLSAAGLTKEAAEEWQLCLRFVGCATVEACNANQGLGNAASIMQDYALAASCWDRCALTIANFMVLEPGAIIGFNHVIHSVRARGLIESGRIDDAIAEAVLAFEAMPGDIQTPIILVPLLDAAGRTSAADEMFERTYEFYHGVLRRYPKSSWHLNSAAWLAAKCSRRLDEALALAQQAVALEPQRWAYTDTLAEIFFQHGDRDMALHWGSRSVSLDPDSQVALKRLDHFRRDPLPRNRQSGITQ